MVRDFGFKGFGWARTGGLCAALLTTALFGACTSYPDPKPVGPWAYEFELGSFTDQRKDAETELRNSTPFTVDRFMKGWRNSVGRNIFANEKARLDITLNAYEVTVNERSYMLSMDVGLRGRDQYGRTLAIMNGRCNAIERIGFDTLGDFGQQAWAQGSTHPLTAGARNATMWQKVMDSCVSELAKQFDTSLAAGVK